MAIGKREKIVAFGISALLCVALVHFLIFNPKINKVREVTNNYNAARGMVTSVKNTTPIQLENYGRTTEEQFRAPFRDIARRMVVQPAQVWSEWAKNREDRAALLAAYDSILGSLDQLLELRQRGLTGNGVRLSFMDISPVGWNIPTELPGVVRAGQQDLFDMLDRLRGHYATLAASEPGAFRDYNLELYRVALAGLEINFNYPGAQVGIPNFFELYQIAGPVVPFLKILQHARLFYARQPATSPMFRDLHELVEVLGFNDQVGKQPTSMIEDFLFPSPVGAQPQNAAVAFLVDITKAGLRNASFGGTLNSDHDLRDFCLFYEAQLNVLIDIVRMANAAGIRDIQFVRMREAFMLPPVPEETGPAAAAPTPAPMDMMMMDDPYGMMYMDMDERGGGGLGGGRFGGGGMGMARPANQTADEDTVAIATPIDLRFVGTNAATSQFLYDLSMVHRPFEVDMVRIEGGRQNQETLLTTTLSLNVVNQMLKVTVPE